MGIEGFAVYGGHQMCGYGLTWVWRHLGWVRGYLKRSGRYRVGLGRLGWVYRVWGR